MSGRHGVTPVVAIVLLLMMTVATAGGAYTYFTGVLDSGQQRTQDALATELAVKDVQCYGATVVAHVTNTGGAALSTTTMDAYVYADDRLVAETTVDVTGTAVLQPGGTTRFDLPFTTPMTGGQSHTVEFVFGDGEPRVTGRCTAMGGLVSYYPLDAGSGTWANSTAGNIAGRLKNGSNICAGGDCPTWVDGKVGGALQLDGARDWVDLETHPDMPSFTIMFWTKVNGGFRYLDLNENQGTRIERPNTDRIDFVTRENGNWNHLTRTATDGEWNHIAIVWSGDSTKLLYLNGTLLGTSTGHQDQDTPGASDRIGDGTTNSIDGVMDDIRIFDRALAGSDIRAIHNATR